VASNGHLREFPLDEAEFNLFYRGDSILVSKAKLQNEDYTFQASGQLIGDEKVFIDQMQLAFSDGMVTNGNQIVFQHKNNRIELKPAEFRLNDGRAEIAFIIENEQVIDASLSIVNLNLTGLASALDLQLPIIGDLFADLAITTRDDKIESAGIIEIKDGRLGNVSFENFTFASDLKENLLRVKELKIEDEQQGGLMVFGSTKVRSTEIGLLPFEIDPNGAAKFSGEFKNFQLNYLDEYLPQDVSIEGSLTGSLAINGTGNEPEMVFAFEVISPRYDKINAQTIAGSGRYTDHRLYFEDLVGSTKGGDYSGEGYIPIDLSLSRSDGHRWLENDPIAMELSAVTSNFEVLTPYLVDVDSVTGDIELELEIVGTPEQPVRNGKVVVKNGTIYALMLDLPIRGVEGSAILKENKFILENLVGKSHITSDASWGSQLKKAIIPAKKTKNSLTDNIRLSGSMDLEEFFWPDLAFLVTGKDVYIRTLLGEIEGVADLNLLITGKDTVSIAGDIIPSEAVLRMEFVQDPYAETPIEGETITHYKLHFPMENGNVFLQNSQMDAEFEGTMSLYQLGNGPYRYSGEVDVRKGKFYYFSDVFDIESGRVVFDPSEFNPQLDFVATTDVLKIQIDVLVTGKLDEPEIVLQADGQEGFYSQGELLELLTIQRRLDGGGPAGDGFGDQSFYIFGKLLENELERNLIRSTPLDEFEIEGSESLMGDSDEDLSVKVGTKMTENVYLSYKQSLSFSEPYEVGVEYKLTPNVSFVISYDEDGQVQVRYRLKRQF
jgi:autotransporter translocation and assembly factor TamB